MWLSLYETDKDAKCGTLWILMLWNIWDMTKTLQSSTDRSTTRQIVASNLWETDDLSCFTALW